MKTAKAITLVIDQNGNVVTTFLWPNLLLELSKSTPAPSATPSPKP